MLPRIFCILCSTLQPSNQFRFIKISLQKSAQKKLNDLLRQPVFERFQSQECRRTGESAARFAGGVVAAQRKVLRRELFFKTVRERARLTHRLVHRQPNAAALDAVQYVDRIADVLRADGIAAVLAVADRRARQERHAPERRGAKRDPPVVHQHFIRRVAA